MKIAITGGTGFVGGHLARSLAAARHEAVLVARGLDRRDEALLWLPGARLATGDVADREGLVEAFSGCEGVAHCAGINRERGEQSFERVHVEGTRAVVEAAARAGVKKVALLSFLRARPGSGSPYHDSKHRAEEIVRGSGLDYTVLKCGVIYGLGDHMLDHLSHALHTFPLFPLVGMKERLFRPVAVRDVCRLIEASLLAGRLSRKTIHVLGPETLPFREGVRRVARAIGKRPLLFPLPVAIQSLFAFAFERTMAIPLVSRAQVRMLAEGMTEPSPPSEPPPEDLEPRTPFTEEEIRNGLPPQEGFSCRDLRPSA